MSFSLSIRIGNRHRNLSSDWQLVYLRNGNWDRSANRNSLELWILNMINIILLIVLLHYRLGNDLLTWNFNVFYPCYVLSLNRFYNLFKLNFFIISPVNLNINFFSLIYRLINFLVINLCSRFHQNFLSKIISDNWLLRNWLQVHQLIFLRNELNFFLMLYNLFLINRLEIQLLARLLVLSVYYLLFILNRFVNLSLLNDLVFPPLNSYWIFNSFYIWLHHSFFDDSVSWSSHWYISYNSFILNQWIICHLFSINRSFDVFLFNIWSLKNSLFDDWLRNDSSSYYWLVDNPLLYLGHLKYLLSLCNKWLGIVYLLSHRGFHLTFIYLLHWRIRRVRMLINFLISILNHLQLSRFHKLL